MAWGPGAIAATQAVANVAAPTTGGWLSGKMNRRQARLQDKLNRKFLDYQNFYNSPAEQRKRWEEAGMNPALAYGQGTPGNQSSPQQAVTPDLPDWAAILGQSVNNLNTTLMQQTQRNLIEANIDKTKAQTTTEGIKQSVMSANPILRSDFVQATIERMQAEAKLKGHEARLLTQTQWRIGEDGSFEITSRMQDKLDSEIDLLKQRFKLGSLDTKIKGEVLNSKEMQNAILEVQKKFMTEFTLTPETWTQFVKIFLTKLF